MIAEGVTGEELDPEAREELRTLPKELALLVAKHLVMAGQLVDDDADLAYKHAKTARRLASRVGVVREACGLAAYHAGAWSEALSELRAARRLPGREGLYLAILADCERGLGRPERALDITRSPEAAELPKEERIELKIVESGARRDLGQFDAAVVVLEMAELKDRRLRPWSARLFYAYADALVEAGRPEESKEWFLRAAAADRDEETDAAERYAELDGLSIIDAETEDTPAERFSDEEDAPAEAEPADEETEAVLEQADEEPFEEPAAEEQAAPDPLALTFQAPPSADPEAEPPSGESEPGNPVFKAAEGPGEES
ncbi:hypothetical protein [Actinocorallia longicatena]|uniref:hypothetical protein n=1 Tax=Actinocorallia longicatena TaxID=111803 RepID=UPI0031D25EC7